MRRLPVLLLPLLLLLPSAHAHPIGGSFSVASPSYVNFLLDGFETPDLAPGESGPFTVAFRNTYPYAMRNVTLRFEVYRYVQLDTDLAVDASWPHARPAFRDPSTGQVTRLAYDALIPPLGPGEAVNVSAVVLTDEESPHGGLTDQGSYFVRAYLSFDLTDGVATNRSVLMSKGHFTAEEFATARDPADPCATWSTEEQAAAGIYCEGLLNLTSLGRAKGLDHLDGLLPDTGFAVKDRMPLWPFVALGGLMGGSLLLAFLFHAEENPGKYPRAAQWWLGVKGRLRGVRPGKRT